MHSRLRQALVVLDQKRAARLRFEREVLEHLEELKNMAEAAYRLGRGDLLDLLDATRSRTERRRTYIDVLEEEIRAQLELLAAAGELLEAAMQQR